jgi:hypothetical protein
MKFSIVIQQIIQSGEAGQLLQLYPLLLPMEVYRLRHLRPEVTFADSVYEHVVLRAAPIIQGGRFQPIQ